MLISATKLLTDISRTCKAKRQALGLRQLDLAKRCGVTGATIIRFERSGGVGLDVFTRIVVALNMGEAVREAITVAATPPSAPKSGEEFLRGSRVRERIRLKTHPTA